MPDFPEFDAAVADAAQGYLDETGLGSFLGFKTIEVGPGRMRCGLEVRPDLLNPFGMMHGGVISALVDHVLGAVCYPVVPRGTWGATTEFKLNFVAPVRSGTVVATAEILSMTRRTAIVRIDVTNDDQLVALAQGTVTLKPPKA
jgi:1,4-dihydroxy-2-naphthoyl-CoA hydrolase